MRQAHIQGVAASSSRMLTSTFLCKRICQIQQMYTTMILFTIFYKDYTDSDVKVTLRGCDKHMSHVYK